VSNKIDKNAYQQAVDKQSATMQLSENQRGLGKEPC